MAYVQLMPMGLYEPPGKDAAMEAAYHLAYGLGVASTFRVLSRA